MCANWCAPQPPLPPPPPSTFSQGIPHIIHTCTFIVPCLCCNWCAPQPPSPFSVHAGLIIILLLYLHVIIQFHVLLYCVHDIHSYKCCYCSRRLPGDVLYHPLVHQPRAPPAVVVPCHQYQGYREEAWEDLMSEYEVLAANL